MPTPRVSGTTRVDHRETVRCFVQVVTESAARQLCNAVESKLNGWEFETPVMHATFEVRPAATIHEAVEHVGETSGLYPESMHLIVGANLLDGSRLNETVATAVKRFTRGHVGIIHLGKPNGSVEGVLDGSVSLGNVRAETKRVIRKLRYHRPTGKRELPCAPVYRRISDYEQFEESLRLRFTVYDLLGYIPERFRSARTGLELDYLDKYSMHYCCMLPSEDETKPAAVLRMITRGPVEDSKLWAREARSRHPDPKLERSARSSQFQEMPVFNAIKALDRFQALLQSEEAEYCELSRVIVGEAYRGLGLSRALIQFALADIKRWGASCVFLGCVPEQVGMYANCGFQHFESDIVTFARIRQPAQAMYQFLD